MLSSASHQTRTTHNSLMKLKLFATIGAVAVLTTSVLANVKSADAATTGVLTFVGDNAFTSSSLSFSDLTNNPGKFNISANSTGSFAGLGGTEGSIKNITAPPGGTSSPLNLPNFLTISTSSGPIAFDLQNFTQSQITIATVVPGISFAIVTANGVFRDNSGTTVGSGIFSAQVSPGQSTGSTTYSASISAVPEPSDVAGIVTLGVLGTVFVAGNRKRFGLTA